VKHRRDFPNFNNSLQYAKEAKKFLDNPPAGALVKLRRNGDKIVWDPGSNIFAVADRTGTPKTMFKPDPTQHGFSTNLDYLNAQ
jgi:filamentous hemagglutinin